jgi:hypothetical protein
MNKKKIALIDRQEHLADCAELQQEKFVAVTLHKFDEKLSESPQAEVSFIILSSEDKSFIFDLSRVDAKSNHVLFIKEILQSESSTKICHGSRNLSEALQKFGIRLWKFHDTKAWCDVLFPTSPATSLVHAAELCGLSQDPDFLGMQAADGPQRSTRTASAKKSSSMYLEISTACKEIGETKMNMVVENRLLHALRDAQIRKGRERILQGRSAKLSPKGLVRSSLCFEVPPTPGGSTPSQKSSLLYAVAEQDSNSDSASDSASGEFLYT